MRKKTHSSPLVDMTPMVDLGFLLVTFFMMTTQFNPSDLVPIVIPHATSEIKLPESNNTVLLISPEGNVYLRMSEVKSMKKLAKNLSEKFKLNLTDDEINKFASLTGVGIPFGNLKQFLGLSENDIKNVSQPGIPKEIGQNELFNWVIYSRITNPDSRVVVKADRKTPYPAVKRVMDTLQEAAIVRFSLITDVESTTS
jgi:biopolymer transport protein ExbD